MNKKCGVCKAVGYSKKATNCIEIMGGKKDSTILYLCKSCAKMFADPLCSCKSCSNSNKKGTRAIVVGPECSNVHHIQPGQQPGGSLNG
jgi:hypothetical protein